MVENTATAKVNENAGAEKLAGDFVKETRATQEKVAGQMQKMMEKNMSKMNQLTDFAKGNVEAVVESAKAAAKGAQTLTSHYVAASKKSAEEMRAAYKTFTSVKTPNEFIQAQNEFAKAQFDRAVANFSEATETWLKVAKEVTQPLSARVSVAVEAVKKNVAA